MDKIDTLTMAKLITENPSLKFETELDGKKVEAYFNKNGGISIGTATLNFSGDAMKAKWQLVNKNYTFMEAINSGKKIKYSGWKDYSAIVEALYSLLDYPIQEVISFINGHWNIEE